MGSDGAIPVTPGTISVSGHISNKLHDFYAISNLINFANWSRLVWLSQNIRKGTVYLRRYHGRLYCLDGKPAHGAIPVTIN